MEFLNKLNPAQQEAVITTEGPLLVLAGAGSGKTRVITYRIIYLLEKGTPPSKILGLTFTNKASQEMRERVFSLTNSNVLISTFHSLGARILRESIGVLGYKRSFAIYDEEDSNKLLLSCIDAPTPAEAKEQVKIIRAYISNFKNSLIPLDQEDNPYCFQIFERYQQKLKEYQAVDFDDLLYLPVRILREFPEARRYYQERWSYLLIDEYQDTNNAQYELVKCLLGPEQRLCVVGDPDQSIYSWRGANIQNIMNFEEDYPEAKVIRLEQNYRSRSNILEAANALIYNNEKRYEKNLWSGRGEGDKIKFFTGSTEYEESEFVARQVAKIHEEYGTPYNRIAVFYRTHALSRPFEDAFYRARVPYVIVGGISFYQRREVKDILSILKMVQSSSDFIAFARSINFPKRGIGPATLEKLRENATEEGLSIFNYCEALLAKISLKTSLRISTKQREGLETYVQNIQKLREIESQCSLQTLVEAAINYSDYLSLLMEDRDTYEERKENLASLVAKAAEWESSEGGSSLTSFLEELSLKSTLDEADGSKKYVHLMSIHNSKGLEYDTVFLVGLEEELFPHARSYGKEEELEEERRLCYVGMTRAEERLFLTNASARYFWGNIKNQTPSRFLREIPKDFIERVFAKRRF
ncbi:MAG: UvrD-helicase domain-containing protein [Parachlamydiaceae bacterium]|nr:UvrD-helicase domain-containing protein [Parachlamydiaceae bacterium]